MHWPSSIAVADGLEENNTERIVSYIIGDEFIQLSGFFTFQEIFNLSSYLESYAPQPQNAQPLTDRPPD